MNISFVKRGPAWRTVLYTEELPSKKKKKKNEPFNGRELLMYRASMVCTWNNFIFNFIRFTSQTELTTQLMEYFVTGYSMEKVHTVLLPNSDWKTINVTYSYLL